MSGGIGLFVHAGLPQATDMSRLDMKFQLYYIIIIINLTFSIIATCR